MENSFVVYTTPEKIDFFVRKLMDKLPDARNPVFLNLKKESYARVGNCFENVNEKIKRNGGTIQYGWIIWYIQNHFIEGELHAIWKSPDGKMIDITPKRDMEKKILFVPDNQTVYLGEKVKNISYFIKNNELVSEEDFFGF